jgi:diguanylate cyclase (GGDEF)-like protein
MNRFLYLSRWPKTAIVGLGFAVLSGLYLVDTYTPPDQSFLIFYLVPLFLWAWYVGQKAGLLMALLASAAWISSDEVSGTFHMQSSPAVPYWNIAVKTLFMMAMAFHFFRMRRAYDQEKLFARADILTGVANRRAFFETLTLEIARAHRFGHPLTMAYVDIDNFKKVNDQWGHDQGDELLKYVAGSLRDNMRATDLVARVGGDEFAILAPVTPPEQAAKVMEKVHTILSEGVQERNWPVTFSIGVTTFAHPPASADDIVRRADELMYIVKKNQKNALSHEIV